MYQTKSTLNFFQGLVIILTLVGAVILGYVVGCSR